MQRTSISLTGFLRIFDGHGPVGVVWVLAAGGGEVQLLQASGDRAHLSRAYLAIVYLRHGRYLETGAGQKDLVGGVELGAAHVALVGRHPKLLLGELHDGIAGYALQDVGSGGRGGPTPPAHG